MQSTFGGTKSAGFEGPIPPPPPPPKKKKSKCENQFPDGNWWPAGVFALLFSPLIFFASHSILSPALPLQILYSPVFSSERRAMFVSKYKKEEKNFFF